MWKKLLLSVTLAYTIGLFLAARSTANPPNNPTTTFDSAQVLNLFLK